jgi:alpha-beta hydrolase superfamily lysophospholipase
MTTPVSIELPLNVEESVFGELAEAPDSKASVLLLHDRGSDLDSVRPFAVPLRTLQISTLMIDLPGHGLSGGDWDSDASRCVESALSRCATGGLPIGVVAVGEAVAMLWRAEPQQACAVALVSPRLDAGWEERAEPWRKVPMIAMGDPSDPATRSALDELSGWTRGWAVQLSAHLTGGPADWPPQMVHATAAFVAEQAAYRSRRDGSVYSS